MSDQTKVIVHKLTALAEYEEAEADRHPKATPFRVRHAVRAQAFREAALAAEAS